MFEVKKDEKPTGRLYVVVTIQNKKEDGPIMGTHANAGVPTGTSSKISIPDIVKNINPANTNMLSKFPAQMLDTEQRKAKIQGLDDRGKDLIKKAMTSKKYGDTVNVTAERIDQLIEDYGSETDPN